MQTLRLKSARKIWIQPTEAVHTTVLPLLPLTSHPQPFFSSCECCSAILSRMVDSSLHVACLQLSQEPDRSTHSCRVDVVSGGQKHTDVMGKQGIVKLCLLLFYLLRAIKKNTSKKCKLTNDKDACLPQKEPLH